MFTFRLVVKIMVPFLGTLDIRGRIILGTQKGTIILTAALPESLRECLKQRVVREITCRPDDTPNKSLQKFLTAVNSFIEAIQ